MLRTNEVGECDVETTINEQGTSSSTYGYIFFSKLSFFILTVTFALNLTQEELERACRLAEAHDFIMRQPQGYDTMAGERGSSLSGGQRQRLAIVQGVAEGPADPDLGSRRRARWTRRRKRGWRRRCPR